MEPGQEDREELIAAYYTAIRALAAMERGQEDREDLMGLHRRVDRGAVAAMEPGQEDREEASASRS